MKKFKFRLFYMDPPISQSREALDPHNFSINMDIKDYSEIKDTQPIFDKAYEKSKDWIKKNQPSGTIILLLAQIDR